MRKIALFVTGVALIAGTAVLWAASIETGRPVSVTSISIYQLHNSAAVRALPVQVFEDLI